MSLLLKAAWANRKFRCLAFIMMMATILLPVASQLEIFALGFITRKGPDFFELFAPQGEEGFLQPTDSVSQQQLLDRWRQLTNPEAPELDRNKAIAFLSDHRAASPFEQAVTFVDHHLAIQGHPLQLALFMVAIALFKAITLFVHRYATRLASIAISTQLRQRYFEHLQTMPMQFYQNQQVAALCSRVVSDAASIAEAINATFVNYLQLPFTLLSTFLLCLLTSWQLTTIVFIGLPLLAYPISFLARRVKKVSKQLLLNQERFASVLLDYLSGVQTVKVFAMEEFSMKKYRHQNEQMAELERKSARYDLSSRPIIHTIAMVFLAMAMISGLYLFQLTLPEVLVYCGLLYLFYEPIKKFAEENSHIQRGVAAAERLFELLEEKPQLIDLPNAKAHVPFDKELRFEGVWFRYEEQWVLRDVSFSVKKGEMVALVGPTGSGKSTIAQLIPRLYDVQMGRITLDGEPLTAFQQQALRRMIAFVPQKPFLFLDTIAENIAFGLPYSPDQVTSAARQAHATEFIEKLPHGYETLLQDAGRNLSGGQQQRLAIARALIKKAPLLILDEATSSLDATSEQQIKTALHELRGQITQIVIAHRLSTIEEADRIVFLENGSVLAEGTLEELLESCPPFRIMWKSSQLAATG